MTDPQPAKPLLTALVIAFNEAAQIEACLASLVFCDEIIVLENGSTDRTAELARKAGATVVETDDWPGFGPQKQRALDLAHGEWILSLDADERIDERLEAEIRRAISSGGMAGYRLKRLNYFLGKPLRHGGWYPDPVLRLARRHAARFSSDAVHERLIVDGPVGELETPLVHLSYRSIDDLLLKLRRYANATARARRHAGKRGGLSAAVLRASLTFVKCFVLQLGLLDGAHGFVAAAYRAEETFWRYLAVGWEKGS